MAISGATALVQTLIANKIDTAFCVPGESYLSVLDALYDVPGKINLITCRHEGGAAFMAEANGKMTGKPGICFVTRGPGATNASIGVHAAFQDSTPMILFIGQVPKSEIDREAFQEVDYKQMFGPLCKWVAQIESADRVVEYVTRAFHLAINGRPGPVVLALPSDMLDQQTEKTSILPAHNIDANGTDKEWHAIEQEISKAERPIMMIGGNGWDQESVDNIRKFVEKHDLPVATTFRFQDVFDNAHPNYAGDVGISLNPALKKRINESDLIISIGSRLGEITTSGYSLFDIPFPKQKIIMVHSGADELGHLYRPFMSVNATARNSAKALLNMSIQKKNSWTNWKEVANQDYISWSTPLDTVGDVNLGDVYRHLKKNMPENAIMTNGAGNYAIWLHRFMTFRTFKSQLAPTSGAMGYGLPAAISAKLTDPARPVVCFAGDGCFMMNGQELSTSMQYNIPIIILVFNNSMYGTIRTHQEIYFPHRVSGTSLKNPNFTELAKAYGAKGVKVTKTDEFGPAFDEAIKSQKTTLIEIVVDDQALTPEKTLNEISNQ